MCIRDRNLYYAYVGADPSYTYDFSISIPSGTPTGSYRMRVISPWGSDGFLSSNTNGYGPCGSYQYGNFTDLTLNVTGSNGLAETGSTTPFTIAPNPAAGQVVVTCGGSAGEIVVHDAQGRLVTQQRVLGDRVTLDVHDWVGGVYTVQVRFADGIVTQRLLVE